MLNRKSALVGTPPLGHSRASNEGLFIRRVTAFSDESKHDEAHSPEWGSPDATLRMGGGTISWSAENLSLHLRETSGVSFSHLDSPKSSYVGSPTLCTGGGHGEAGPSSSGGCMRLSTGCESTSVPQSLASPTRKATPLARHLAERNLLTRSVRRSVEYPGQLRSRESAPAQVAVSSPGPAVPAPVLSYPPSSTIEKLPSFMRASVPCANGPEPASIWCSSNNNQRLPDAPSPHPPLLNSLSITSGANGNANGGNGGSGNGNILVPWVTSSRDSGSSITGVGRTLASVAAGPAPRPSRHLLFGSRPQSQQPQPQPQPPQPQPPQYPQLPLHSQSLRAHLSSPASGGDSGGGYMDISLPARPKGCCVTSPVPSRRPSSPPPFSPRVAPACGLIHLWAGVPTALRRGEWTMAQFSISRQLYGGYASSVYKARCLRSGLDVVLKVYTLSSLSDFLRNQVLRELDIHSRLEHSSIVQLMAAFREGDKLVLVLEYVRGGSLDRARRKLGGRMSEPQALELVLVPLLRTLHYLHTRSIVHRDIKPENVLFTSDWKLKVCDYGVSICLLEERAVTRTGSRDYMAPEVQVCPLKRAPDDNKTNAQLAYGTAADIWSLGVMTYELLVGFTPFPGGPPPADERQSGCRSLAFPSCISAEGRSFVLSCLSDLPMDRPTIFELMKHRWVQGALAP